MKDPIIIRQHLTTIDWEINQLTTERIKLEEELARAGLQAVPYPQPTEGNFEATLKEVLKGNWHFKTPTTQARKVFENLGVPLEADTTYWEEDAYYFAEWYNNLAYTSHELEEENEKRELIILNDKLYFKGVSE